MRLAVSAGESPAYGCGNGNIADDLYNKEENAASIHNAGAKKARRRKIYVISAEPKRILPEIT